MTASASDQAASPTAVHAASVGVAPALRASWRGSMQSAVAATLTTPEWWAIALAAFMVRGGILLLLLPIIALPTPAGLITDLSPALEALYLGTPSVTSAVLGAAMLTALLLVLVCAGIAGAWLDGALVREAAASDDLDLAFRPAAPVSSWRAFGLRLAAHVPTLAAVAYAVVRVVLVAYAQSTTPDEPGVSIVDRVVGRVGDALVLVLVAWLFGEVVGALAARRAAARMSNRAALGGSVRQVLSPRGLATFAVTTAVLVAAVLPFALAAERAWEHVRSYLLFGIDAVQLTAAIVVLVATWVLGLAVIGAALAWRATAWTSEVTIR